MRVASEIMLDTGERRCLERLVRSPKTAQRLVERAKIILAAGDGKESKTIAAELGCSQICVSKWRTRFSLLRLEGIEKDAPRSGRPPVVRDGKAKEIIEKTLKSKPTGQTHWSTRGMAKKFGVGRMTVQRIWQANQLKPHLIRMFKLSNDPLFVEKLVDVVGLYMNPPEHALVLAVDEKSQIQALDRTQATLPMNRGRNGTMTHDYKRNGTTTLFAALNVGEGKIIGRCMARHRHQEWLEFLKVLDTETPPELALHLIADNYATHKHPKVKKWLAKHPRFHMHFIPTSSSWLNLVERWFRELTDKCIRRGIFVSVDALQKSIADFIKAFNVDPTVYKWTAKTEEILAKIKRARAVLDNQ
ncbi:MAG: IS630 family transposase [Alphaproteobacteria bacterium]|nr:IS630 family transposase [Alphaproteobacteria bacterium]